MALPSLRHIEVQIVADMHGSVLHLYERDCSIQRRYQKVIETAPPIGLSSEMLHQIRDASLKLATLLGYVGVGTVEYLVQGDRFFFLEMNPRLQMEHLITECLTSTDLVQLQLHIAGGEPLPMQQHEVPCSGFALEARLYAEDPHAGFRRTFGRLEQFDLPPRPGIRYETGVACGQMISHYGLLAKVIAHASTHREAAHHLAQTLKDIRVKGLRTNRDFLVAILTHPDFLAGNPQTDFVHTHPELLSQEERERA
jgi:acetyl/propionyl-CoA carboxylase alpha subunit